jgi:hypothetical protein
MDYHVNAVIQLPIKDVIGKKAAQFLKQSGGELMYRGIKNMSKKDDRFLGFVKTNNGQEFPLYLFDVRKDRKASATEKPFHHLLDDWFEDNQGLKARSEAMFCYGEEGIQYADSYGYLFAVFPVGSFSYTWSPSVDDLYTDMHSLIKDAELTDDERSMLHRAVVGKRTDAATKTVLNKFMKQLNYRHNDLAKVLKSYSSEIMVDCDQYLAVGLKRHDWEALSSIKSSLK